MKPTREAIFSAQTAVQKAREEVLGLYSGMTEEEREEVGGEMRSMMLDAGQHMADCSSMMQAMHDRAGMPMHM